MGGAESASVLSGLGARTSLDSDEGSKGWILWISLAIMCSESIVGLVALVASNGLRD